MDCVLRVSGIEVDEDLIAEQHPDVTVCGGSNFDLPSLESPEFEKAFNTVMRFLQSVESSDKTPELDIGIVISTHNEVMKSVEVPPHVLELLSRAGVSLRVSAYLADDE